MGKTRNLPMWSPFQALVYLSTTSVTKKERITTSTSGSSGHENVGKVRLRRELPPEDRRRRILQVSIKPFSSGSSGWFRTLYRVYDTFLDDIDTNGIA